MCLLLLKVSVKPRQPNEGPLVRFGMGIVRFGSGLHQREAQEIGGSQSGDFAGGQGAHRQVRAARSRAARIALPELRTWRAVPKRREANGRNRE